MLVPHAEHFICDKLIDNTYYSGESLLMDKERKIRLTKNYSPKSDVSHFLGDRLKLISQIKKSGSKAELIVTSPPYNVGKEYEDQVSLNKYIEMQRETISACVDILSDTGSICWQVGHYIEGSVRSKETYPLDIVLYPIFKEFGLILKNRIVWHFGHGLHESIRFSGRHETLLWFVKSNQYTFNLDPIRIPQKYPGKRSYRGDKKGQPSGNPLGKNPSDVWDMPNVKANHVEKTIHPCQFPIAMIIRLIDGLTNQGDLVFDPYLGVGTTTSAAVLSNRRGVGSDIMQEYIDIANKRVRMAWDGTLDYRPVNKPIHKPSGKESVSQVPDEWEDQI